MTCLLTQPRFHLAVSNNSFPKSDNVFTLTQLSNKCELASPSNRDVTGTHASPGSYSNAKERTWERGWNGPCEFAWKRGQTRQNSEDISEENPSRRLSRTLFRPFHLRACAWVEFESEKCATSLTSSSRVRELGKNEQSNKFDIQPSRLINTARKFLLPARPIYTKSRTIAADDEY